MRLTVRLRSGPCVISIDELFILCTPREDFEYDETREKEWQQELKFRLLESLENQWKFASASSTDSSYYPSYSSFLSFSTSFFANFTENLQFDIKNVHFRFEDTESYTNSAVGFTIENLSVRSADEDWKPTVVTGNSVMTRKLVELDNFAMYWDTNTSTVSECQRNEVINQMRHLMQDYSSREFVLSPVSARAFLSRNRSHQPLSSRSTPRIAMNFVIDEIAISINIKQYQQLLTIVDNLNRKNKLLLNCRWRPKVKVSEDPKSWWKYAVDANLQSWRESRKRENWEFVLERAKMNCRYFEAYFNYLVQPDELTKEVKQLKDQVECEFSFDELRILRDVAFKAYQKSYPEQTSSKSKGEGWGYYLSSWLPSWVSGSDPNSSIDGTFELTEKASIGSALEEELIDAMNLASDDMHCYSKDALFAQINFSLEKASALLLADPDQLKGSPVGQSPHSSFSNFKQIMLFELIRPYITFESMPRLNTRRVKARFSSFTLQDKVSHNKELKYLISPQTGQKEAHSSLFELVFETKLVKTITLKKLYVKTEPLEIVYNKSAADVLYRFFSSKSLNSKSPSVFTRATRTQYENLKRQTKAELHKAVEDLFIHDKTTNLTKWEFDLNICAPQLIFPLEVKNKHTLVIMDLGRFVLRNCSLDYLLRESEDEAEVFITPPSTPTKETLSSNDFTEGAQKLYQRYQVDILDVQLLVDTNGKDWNYALHKGSGPLHVLNKFSLSFELRRRVSSVIADMPRVIISGNLPQLLVYLNECKLISLAQLLNELVFKPVEFSTEVASNLQLSKGPNSKSTRIFFLAEFSISRFLVAVQSHGENLIEMQVFGVHGKFEKSKHSYSVDLTVNSMLMIDAHQKLGKEYEVLLASHKDLTIDSALGAMRDAYNRGRSYSTIASTVPNKLIPEEALIRLHFTSDNQASRELDVVFNHLDVIANQETLVELVGFFKRCFPSPSNFNNSKGDPKGRLSRRPYHGKTYVSMDFKQLNVLLLRSAVRSANGESKKLATASICEACVRANLWPETNISISLRNLKASDMSKKHYPEILKIGPDLPNKNSIISQGVEFMAKKASSENLLDLDLTLNSLYYVHSPHFLKELALCAEEFKHYMSELAETIRTAATEVAIEFVLSAEPPAPDNKKTRKTSQSLLKELRLRVNFCNPLIVLPLSGSFIRGVKKFFRPHEKIQSDKPSLFESLAVAVDVQSASVRLVTESEFEFEVLNLFELTLKEVYLFHTKKSLDHRGHVKCALSCDYFNVYRNGWEPCLEQWTVTIAWDRKTEKWSKDGIVTKVSSDAVTQKTSLQIISGETLNLNLTNTLMEMVCNLKKSWDSESIDKKDDDDSGLDVKILTSSPMSLLIESHKRRKTGHISTSELRLTVDLYCVGVSLVNHLYEELMYITFSGILSEYIRTDHKHALNCTIRTLQADNQLREGLKEVSLYLMPKEPGDPMNGQPALSVSCEKYTQSKVHHFTEFQMKIRDIVLNLEELLLLKMYQFFGYDPEAKANNATSFTPTKKRVDSYKSFVYMVLFEIVLRKINLSVYTAIHMPAELYRLKDKLGLSLLSFEDAKVTLEPFKRENSLETLDSFIKSIISHYKTQLHNQAVRILGTVDFLGNPIGLMNDVTEGLSGLIVEGNVGGLVTSITHGISNSTAKFMSSLSNGLEATTVDTRHQQMRRRIQQNNRNHLKTGLKGLGVGIIGGVTSIVTQTFDGVVSDGVEGLVSGFGKGLLGTVTKPAVGILDFATGVSTAVRETVRKISHHEYQQRKRLPRVCLGPNGLLPPYDLQQAQGQQYFYQSLGREDRELFDSWHSVSSDTSCIISTMRVRFLIWSETSARHGKVILSIPFADLIKCTTDKKQLAKDVAVFYLVLVSYEEQPVVEDFSNATDFPSFGPMGEASSSKGLTNRTVVQNRLRCSSDRVALRICQVINLAKSAFDRNQL